MQIHDLSVTLQIVMTWSDIYDFLWENLGFLNFNLSYFLSIYVISLKKSILNKSF